MRAGGFPGNPGGLVVSILKTAGGRAPAHQARGRGRSTWRPTERSRRCSDGTAGRRQRSAGGWTARSRRVSEYRRSGGIEPTRPRGGKGAPAGGTGGGKDGQHTEVGSRLHVTTPESRPGQISLGDGGGHRLASWTSGYATARSEAICRGAGCGRTRTSGSVGGQGQQRPWSTRPPGEGMARTLDTIFGGEGWRTEITAPDVNERMRQAVRLLARNIGAKWWTYVRMVTGGEATRYILLHLTNHDKGRDLIKDCIWSIIPEGGFEVLKSEDPRQLMLIEREPDLHP